MPDAISSPAAAPIFLSVAPIGDTNVTSLPVQNLPASMQWYGDNLGFAAISQTDTNAVLMRDDVTIGLAVNGEDPEQASVYFGVRDVDALRQELEVKGLAPSPLRVDTYGGNNYRVFFAREPGGVCFCFGQSA